MKISYDKHKREVTLKDRGLDFIDADKVLNGKTFRFEDTRKDYGETRVIAVGHLEGRMVIVGYVEREQSIHIFSMRKANEREIEKYQEQFEEG